jgi:hypothetical protein
MVAQIAHELRTRDFQTWERDYDRWILILRLGSSALHGTKRRVGYARFPQALYVAVDRNNGA